MVLKDSKKNWYTNLRLRLAKTGDLEPGQAIVRLLVATVLLGYFCIPWNENQTFASIFKSTPNLVIIVASTLAFLIFAEIIRNPIPSPFRRVLGTTIDVVSLSIVLHWTGGDHIILFFFYLWVILGNGFRYGIPYLYISYGLSLVGFTSVIAWGSYWQQNQQFALSLLIILFALPIYTSVLLKKLHAAVASAKSANEAKSRFLANMSHELRTPLNGVIGMGELLRETNLSYEQSELANTLNSSAHTLLELIENVLDIAKIEAGKVTINSKPFDLHALVNSVIYMLAPQGASKDVIVYCTIDPDTPFSLSGDQQHLKQVLINLIGNAIKFTDEGSVNLHVFRKGGEESKPVIHFDIIDTGIGIPLHSQSNIFDNFAQSEINLRRSYQGTGLGTAISKELVELMDGEIGLESEELKGSRFWFEIPFTTVPHNSTSISSIHLLLLASNDTAVHIRPALRNWNVKFEWVRSPARALSLMIQAAEEGNHYNSVIVDQSVMTDVNPAQFAQMIRAEPLLETFSLVLVNSSDTMMNLNTVNQFYISTIADPQEKRTIYNAIHAAKSVQSTDSNVVTLEEHYSSQKNARPLNILVAEDNRINQQVINGILKFAGHTVELTDNGEGVLEVLGNDAKKYDILIVDRNMPGMNGIDVVKAVRFLDSSHSLPIIMLTADATPEARNESLDAGASAFLTKPINSRILLEKIASLSRNQTDGSRKHASIPNKSLEPKGKVETESSKQHWFDENALRELSALGEGPQFIQSLVKNFIEDAERHITCIKRSSVNDYLEYREALHALKGSSTELGAGLLVKICLEGEALKPYDLNTDKIKRLVDQTEEVFTKTKASLVKAVSLELNVEV